MDPSINKTVKDDVASLCAHLGLNPAEYRHFSNGAALRVPKTPIKPMISPAGADAKVPFSMLIEPTSGSAETGSMNGSDRAQTPLPIGGVGTVSPVLLANSGLQPKSRIENSVGAHSMVSRPNAAVQSIPATPPAPRWPSLRWISRGLPRNVGSSICLNPTAFHSIGGGVGVTTILATTAKALSMMGRRVLVADGSERSTLPLFFGARDFLGEMNSVVVANGVPTYLLLRDSSPSLDADSSDEWLWSKVAQLDNTVDSLLMEPGPDMARRTQNWLDSEGISIFVLEPDMRSAVALRQTLEHLEAEQARFSKPIPTYFVLNKFDAASPFNVDMLHWLQDELGGMLAPVVLRRDYRVNDSLAEGKTVLDYAPGSEIAQDFLAFAEWLSAGMQ